LKVLRKRVIGKELIWAMTVAWSILPNRGRCAPSAASRRPAAVAAVRSDSPGDGIVRVSRETKGRKGKGVTVITGVPLPPAELKALSRQLKQACGSGGTVKNGTIEIQGDHRDRLVAELKQRGFTVKRAGG
jgi:translation initiation factor 1